MNLGFYIDSQKQSETTNKIYIALNAMVEGNLADNVNLFYNDIDFNPITPKFGCFNSTDIWYFTGKLIITSIKNALSLDKVINKFKPFFLYDGEKNSALELIAINNKMPIITQTEEHANYIKRVTGDKPRTLENADMEKVLGVINDE
jgi:hypothetical protein